MPGSVDVRKAPSVRAACITRLVGCLCIVGDFAPICFAIISKTFYPVASSERSACIGLRCVSICEALSLRPLDFFVRRCHGDVEE